MKNLSIYFLVACIMLCVVGCKPTENNYKQAYDAAVAHKQKNTEADKELGIPESGLMVDGEQQVATSETSYITRYETLEEVYTPQKKLIKDENLSETGKLCRFHIIVGEYKMPTNAKSQAEDLENLGYFSSVARHHETYYVVLGSFITRSDAERGLENFLKREKNYALIGLNGRPLMIVGECKKMLKNN